MDGKCTTRSCILSLCRDIFKNIGHWHGFDIQTGYRRSAIWVGFIHDSWTKYAGPMHDGAPDLGKDIDSSLEVTALHESGHNLGGLHMAPPSTPEVWWYVDQNPGPLTAHRDELNEAWNGPFTNGRHPYSELFGSTWGRSLMFYYNNSWFFNPIHVMWMRQGPGRPRI